MLQYLMRVVYTIISAAAALSCTSACTEIQIRSPTGAHALLVVSVLCVSQLYCM